MSRHNIPLGKIPGSSYYPPEFKNWPPVLYWLMVAVSALMLFARVLLHELEHSVVATRYKIQVHSITLFLFGGSAVPEFLIAIAGPFVSLVLAIDDSSDQGSPRGEWATKTVDQMMLPLEQLKRMDPDTELWAALQKMDDDGVNRPPVTRDRDVIGMLSREDVIAFLRTLRELGTLAVPARNRIPQNRKYR